MKSRSNNTRIVWSGAAATALALTTLSAAPTPVAAQTPIGVVLNGQTVSLGDVAPTQVAGRVLVPLRGVFESLGATVDYNSATNMVFANQGATRIQLRIGSTQATVNGSNRVLDVPAQVRAGRTMVPLRFLSEALGAQVQWNETKRMIYITTAVDTEPDTATEPDVTVDVPDEDVPDTVDETVEVDDPYPPSDLPSDRQTTLSGTVERNLPGARSFEVLSDEGTLLRVRTQRDEPARLSTGDRVQISGRLRNGVFVADNVRVTQSTGTEVRLRGTVVTVRSARRLRMRAEDGRTIIVMAQTPFEAAVSSGDDVRVVGTLDGNFLRATRIVVLRDSTDTDTTDSTDAAEERAIDFRATVEWVDTVGRTLQVRGDNGQLYVIRYNNVAGFRRDDRVRVVGMYADGITTASNVTRQ